ncbi:hypothetical protein TrCOL_g6735 [Triparma columacea]|uniref:VWFA domain-containing protein n=1 Tax=Triparma columacea TaxID=722753 RepID=A0A9W7G7B4_9STRA|nr:hypothetical protein TrCOL_g6735 [Triparma columacea]
MSKYPRADIHIPEATAVASAPPVYEATIELAKSFEERAQILKTQYKFAPGIANQFNESAETFSRRFWIVDNSGSMATSDGHVLIEGSAGVEGMVSCSRWEELGSSILWHANLAANLEVPTEFRLLNPPGMRAAQIVNVGHGNAAHEMNEISKAMGAGPTGRTPLCKHIKEVVAEIREIADDLRNSGKKALVVVASDGASTDGDVASALRPFHDLPVWLVVRLCTDDDNVVDYWNGIDEELELDMDVIDDLCGEAAEVTAVNPWLIYGVNLHKLREWGSTAKEFDLLDERPFKPVEVRNFLNLIFGSAGTVAHPDLGFDKFVKTILEAEKNCPKVYDPLRKRYRQWVDQKKLRKAVGSESCVIS